jgi:hypothetical protein
MMSSLALYDGVDEAARRRRCPSGEAARDDVRVDDRRLADLASQTTSKFALSLTRS